MDAMAGMDINDAFNYAQAHLIVGVDLLMSSEVTTATRYIKSAANIIERSPGDFLQHLNDESQPSTTLVPSVEVEERFALIAHIVDFRSLLRIHVLEKKIKTVHADVLNDLPVCGIPMFALIRYILTLHSQGPVAQGVLDILNGASNGPLVSLNTYLSVEFWVRLPFSISLHLVNLQFA